MDEHYHIVNIVRKTQGKNVMMYRIFSPFLILLENEKTNSDMEYEYRVYELPQWRNQGKRIRRLYNTIWIELQ